MASALAEAFRSDLPCADDQAAVLAGLARERVPLLSGSAEDSEEDLVLRLRDPRVFGAFAESVGQDRRVPAALRRALLEHVFDLLPLPRTEGELIAVETRAPRRLLALTAALAAGGGLSVLHVMHLVYAVFLDRALVTHVPRRIRSAVLRSVLEEGGGGETLRLLYGGLHLAAVPEREAASELRWILLSDAIPLRLRRSLASLGAEADGGRSSLTRLAQREGLLPEDVHDPEAPEILANIPRLPAGLASACRSFLERAGSA
ncbi:MAG TPA: hypothetical protein VEY12_04220 [Thermoplasmata archaeon]|nr:hypothetical protein [Thermoplasmata archaeon]